MRIQINTAAPSHRIDSLDYLERVERESLARDRRLERRFATDRKRLALS